jgi:hypothetical protein
MGFSGRSASIVVKISIFDWTIGLYSITPTQLINCLQSLVTPLGHLSPNGSLANLAALYSFNGLPDLHRHFKLAIILGLSEWGESAFVA